VPDYDVIVVGGGCNGTGIARDAALRGLRVALVDKVDLGVGATGNSSGMIHGGVRYLLSDIDVTRSSCLDSGFIQRIAPYLLFRIPFLVPVLRSKRFARAWLELTDTFFSAYDRYQPLKNGLPHLRLDGQEVARVLPGLAEEAIGAVAFDEWGINTHRLVAANALSAAEAGADVMMGARTEAVLRRPRGHVYGVRIHFGESGIRRELTGWVVVNAAGAWAPGLAALAGQHLQVRAGRGVHLVFGRRITNHAVAMSAIDGRDVFLMPHGRQTWIGTTDDDHFGDPDDLSVSGDEVEYLLGAVARLLPGVRQLPIIDTMVGLRPTLHDWGPTEDDLSRDWAVVDHALRGAPGLVSVIGGKLASYRLMAEQATDLICRRLRRSDPCRTHRTPLPGAEVALDAAALVDLAASSGLPLTTVQRLYRRQGCRAVNILRRWEGTHEIVCRCSQVTAAEVRHVIRNEWVRDLEQLRRRTGLGAGPCGGARCCARGAALLALELGLPPARVREIVWQRDRAAWKRRAAAAGGRSAPWLALERMRTLAGRDL